MSQGLESCINTLLRYRHLLNNWLISLTRTTAQTSWMGMDGWMDEVQLKKAEATAASAGLSSKWPLEELQWLHVLALRFLLGKNKPAFSCSFHYKKKLVHYIHLWPSRFSCLPAPKLLQFYSNHWCVKSFLIRKHTVTVKLLINIFPSYN